MPAPLPMAPQLATRNSDRNLIGGPLKGVHQTDDRKAHFPAVSADGGQKLEEAAEAAVEAGR